MIFALAESPREAGTIWAGTDDGLVQLTRDGGKNWRNVTPKGLPERIQINSIELSPHDPAAAYVAATMYKHDDTRPYLYKTGDYGRTWTKIVSGIPDGRVHARRARGPRAPRAPLRRHGDRPLPLVRRRRLVAALPAESARRARHGPHGQGRGPRRRDAGPRVLDPRRPRAARDVERGRREEGPAPLPPEPRRPVRLQRRLRGPGSAAPRAASGRTRLPAPSSPTGSRTRPRRNPRRRMRS